MAENKKDLDNSIKKFKDRAEFLNNSNIMDKAIKRNESIYNTYGNENKNTDNRKNGYIEKMTTYLLRSEDVESERYLENPFYRDDSEYYKNDFMNKFFKKEKNEIKKRLDNGNLNDLLSVKHNYSVMSNNDHLFSEDDYSHDHYSVDNVVDDKQITNELYFNTDYCSKLNYQEMSISQIKNLIKFGYGNLEYFNDYELVNEIKYIYNDVITNY